MSRFDEPYEGEAEGVPFAGPDGAQDDLETDEDSE